jgi:hypothetical protein
MAQASKLLFVVGRSGVAGRVNLFTKSHNDHFVGNHRVGVGLQFATVPICSGTRVGHGQEIGPWCESSEIARLCGAPAVHLSAKPNPG